MYCIWMKQQLLHVFWFYFNQSLVMSNNKKPETNKRRQNLPSSKCKSGKIHCTKTEEIFWARFKQISSKLLLIDWMNYHQNMKQSTTVQRSSNSLAESLCFCWLIELSSKYEVYHNCTADLWQIWQIDPKEMVCIVQ